MRTKNIFIIISMLLVFFFLSSITLAIPEHEVENNTVYINSSKAYISATPANLTTDGYVTFRIKPKNYSGLSNLAWGFNTSVVEPRKGQYYNETIVKEVYTNEYTINNITNITDTNKNCNIGNFENNDNKKKIKYMKRQIIYNKSNNITNYKETEEIICYENRINNTFYYNITNEYEKDWHDLYDIETINHSFDDFNKWHFLPDYGLEEDVTYKMRVYMDIKLNTEGKYGFAVLPEKYGKNITKANDNNELFYLDPWWNSNWAYRKPIDITEQTGNTVNDYLVPITIQYDSDMNNDFSDLRFTNSDDTELSYYIREKVNSDYADLYVKLNSLSASSTKTIYMYYGNSGASSASDSNIFLYFNGFEDGSTSELETISGGGTHTASTTYSHSGDYSAQLSISNGDNTDFADDAISGTSPTDYVMYWSYYIYFQQTYDNLQFKSGLSSTSSTDYVEQKASYDDDFIYLMGDEDSRKFPDTESIYHIEVYADYGQNTAELYVNGTKEFETDTSNLAKNTIDHVKYGIYGQKDEDLWVDDYFFKEKLRTEPTYTVGAEQTQNTAPNAPTNPSPSDGATISETSPTLSVDVSAPDGDNLNVSFYNASNNNLIGTDTGVASGGTANFTWSGLSDGSSHSWYAVADDGSATNQSDTWSFSINNPPNITLNSPANNSVFEKDNVLLNATYSDLDNDDGNVSFYEDFPLTTEDNYSFTVTGSLNFDTPGNLYDNRVNTTAIGQQEDEWAEIDIGEKQYITEFRYYGDDSQNGDGEFKLQYYNGSSWIDLKTGLSSRGDSWSDWIDINAVKAQRYRVYVTVTDTVGFIELGESEIRFGDVLLKQFNNTPSNTDVTYNWTNLNTGKYSWFATANDGLETTTSETRTITISPAPCECPSINNNFEINYSNNCVINTTCDLGTGNLTITGDNGYFKINSTFYCNNRYLRPEDFDGDSNFEILKGGVFGVTS